MDIIYVSPFQMTPDVLGYYMKILEIGDIDGATKRVNFMVPENVDKFPNHFSLTQILLYSPKTLQRVKSMIRGKQAYIVPGNVSTDDIKLSIRLAIPIMSGEPQKQHLYSTKSHPKNKKRVSNSNLSSTKNNHSQIHSFRLTTQSKVPKIL